MTTTLWILVAIFGWPAIIFIGIICLAIHYIRKDNLKQEPAKKNRATKGSKQKTTIIPLHHENH